jgi:hypothetical protein
VGDYSPIVSRCRNYIGLFGITEMNERIDKLAEQAGASVLREQTRSGDWVDFSDYTGFDHTKFAELIVRKCLELAHHEHKMALEYEWDNDDTATSIRESISKHFGVEE